jgi:hypothetical protein
VGRAEILKDVTQPPVVYNRIKRKINTVCGIIEVTDPKAARAAKTG